MPASKLMRAIRVSEFGGPSVLKLCSDVAVPEPGRRQVSSTWWSGPVLWPNWCPEELYIVLRRLRQLLTIGLP